jgi:general secretion pathway protein H
VTRLRRLRQCALSRRAGRGLTLVEVLIVLALMALLVGAILLGPGMLTSSRQRAAATLVLSGVRLGLTRATATGYPIRMVFDLERHRVMLEQASSSVFLREKEEGQATGSGAEAATEIEKAARAEAERIAEGPTAPRPRFAPVQEFGFDGDEPEAGRSLGSGIELVQVQTDHDLEPVKEGRAYLYFWPRAGTERAAIQLRRAGDEQGGLTVMVSALTGRVRIERGRVDLPPGRLDEAEYSEREEP